MPKKKYYQVDTKKIEGLQIEAKCKRGRTTDIPIDFIPNITRAGKSSVQLEALQQTNEECASLYLLHPSHKWIDRFKEADKKKRRNKII